MHVATSAETVLLGPALWVYIFLYLLGTAWEKVPAKAIFPSKYLVIVTKWQVVTKWQQVCDKMATSAMPPGGRRQRRAWVSVLTILVFFSGRMALGEPAARPLSARTRLVSPWAHLVTAGLWPSELPCHAQRDAVKAC
jgi:hypothetical protein